MIRKTLFWLHLIAGVLAGVVILIMSVTGVLLTYEKQIIAWAESGNYTVASSPSASVEALLVSAPPGSTAVTLRRDEPPKIAIPGAPQSGVRQFFRTMTDWHRWLGASAENRATPRAITGASNLAFLFIVVSGLVLWFPRKWSWNSLRAVTWFRGGPSGKARDFNWHNTAGFWTCIPLFVIVLSGVVMSYPWANDLVYTMNGVQPPAGKGKGKGKGAPVRPSTISTANLDALVAAAKNIEPEWRTISFTAPPADGAPVTFTIETGTSGQPQYRSTVTLDRATAAILRTDRFSDQDAGRRARSWMRFAHTGEYYGLVGQTIAGVASLGGVLLVWTGFALAFRRLRAWLARRNQPASTPQPAPAPDKVAA